MIIVAPPVGAWIEMALEFGGFGFRFVAPPVGAWIEIRSNLVKYSESESLPPWERGLKYFRSIRQKDVY